MSILSEILPVELEGLVDVKAIRNLAQDGLRREARGIDFAYRIEPMIANLEALVSWLQTGRIA
jgi:hypothetical protein